MFNSEKKCQIFNKKESNLKNVSNLSGPKVKVVDFGISWTSEFPTIDYD